MSDYHIQIGAGYKISDLINKIEELAKDGYRVLGNPIIDIDKQFIRFGIAKTKAEKVKCDCINGQVVYDNGYTEYAITCPKCKGKNTIL